MNMRQILHLANSVVPRSWKNTRLYHIAVYLLRPHNSIYPAEGYGSETWEEIPPYSATMARSILERFHPRTVIDVGCGAGALLEAFRDLNCAGHGLEYSDAGLAFCRRRGLSVQKFNIEKDQFDHRQYDTAVSFEVAEHLAPWSAKSFVKLLCNLSPLVIISAATPGQGGTAHINEQPHSYWIKKFRDNGYYFDDVQSLQVRTEWKDANVPLFYTNNVMVFCRSAQRTQ